MTVRDGCVSLPAAIRRAIVLDARACHPGECCGFLVGLGGQIRGAVPMANVAGDPRTAFEVLAADHIALRRTLRHQARALEIIGVYHSHPRGQAWPSPLDIREAHYPAWAHVIVGFVPRVHVRAFRIEEGRATRLRIMARAGRARRTPKGPGV